MKNIIVIYFGLTVLLFGCSDTKEKTDFDKGPMLKNIAFNLAIPAYEKSLASFENLQHELVASRNKTDTARINILRNSWKTAAINWAKTAPYRFGPVDELLIKNSFYYFPVDTTKLSKQVSNFDGNRDHIQSLGSNSQGLGALEFLLFTEDSVDQKTKIAFMEMLCNRLVELNRQVLKKWRDQYAKEFAQNTGSELMSSITKLANQWIEVVDYMKGDEIGRPAGKTVGIERNIFNLQAPYSKISSELIESKLEALQESFNGGTKEGVDDYLNSLNIKMSDNIQLDVKINQQINSLKANLEGEKKPLSELILEESKKVDLLYLESLNLSIILKTDLMSQLGLVTTFSDSDGD
ncbi:imelysin family protein [Marivirga harenae]|uniref:imelysin family protein n=1 Tax=Marivirga harenae TaxID=2010992 RepID=UPI0026E05FE6|nr:imelysin family protein [Marivirga harenae]WKV13317.1 imelysin family protein [Marivirga harenae]